MSVFQPGAIRDELTRQLSVRSNPIRAFLEDRFGGPGMYEMEHNAPAVRREPWLIVPSDVADQDTIRDAAELMLRAVTHQQLDLLAARQGAGDYRVAGLYVPDDAADELAGLAVATANPAVLARACWALALLCRARGMKRPALKRSPVGALAAPVTRDGLLGAAADGVVAQLVMFHHIFTTRLVPALGPRGLDGPSRGVARLAGAKYVDTQPALLGGGLLLELVVSDRWVSFRRAEVFRLIACALLDFDDEFGIGTVGVFNARYADLEQWSLQSLLDRVAGERVSLPRLRAEFRDVIVSGR